MKITKTNSNANSSAVSIISKEDLRLINTYTRKELDETSLYTFNITLCDNEIDRDYERFTTEALKTLVTLFIGKTGISDHDMKSSSQNARVFKTWLETSNTIKTSTGEAYTALKASAYMARTDKNAALIDEIEAGIKKEVSVGCSISQTVCSICSSDMRMHSCEHIKGKMYKGQTCHGVLSSPTDAYEWSFVAVPAQKNAGVTKNFTHKEDTTMHDVLHLIKSASNELTISKAQVKELCDYIVELEKMSTDAIAYRAALTGEIEKYALIVMPKVNSKEFVVGCKGMNIDSLKAFKEGLEAQANELLPLTTQFKSHNKPKLADNSAFKI
ncbi:MAG: hypothetical protein R3Y27_00465 [Clostridia bacterium]